jgi:hypothetical protein
MSSSAFAAALITDAEGMALSDARVERAAPVLEGAECKRWLGVAQRIGRAEAVEGE